uniref:Uncharacterized protein n=1 Tax=Cacopsylla melanoneura TaxID=428564 RepID=A0A8D8XEN1_9HEMI
MRSGQVTRATRYSLSDVTNKIIMLRGCFIIYLKLNITYIIRLENVCYTFYLHSDEHIIIIMYFLLSPMRFIFRHSSSNSSIFPKCFVCVSCGSNYNISKEQYLEFNLDFLISQCVG